jgi:hypothetical protein
MRVRKCDVDEYADALVHSIMRYTEMDEQREFIHGRCKVCDFMIKTSHRLDKRKGNGCSRCFLYKKHLCDSWPSDEVPYWDMVHNKRMIWISPILSALKEELASLGASHGILYPDNTIRIHFQD